MCAAPGSKTAQLIEMLHADMNDPFPSKSAKTTKNFCDFEFLLFLVKDCFNYHRQVTAFN